MAIKKIKKIKETKETIRNIETIEIREITEIKNHQAILLIQVIQRVIPTTAIPGMAAKVDLRINQIVIATDQIIVIQTNLQDIVVLAGIILTEVKIQVEPLRMQVHPTYQEKINKRLKIKV